MDYQNNYQQGATQQGWPQGQQMAQNQDHALGWDDEISKESEFLILPEGDYDFVVKKFERSRYEGGLKISACPKAVLTIEITAPDGQKTNILHTLLLHTKTESFISDFFIGIGQKIPGQPFSPNWNTVTGSFGRCQVYVDKYTNSNGNTSESNKIKKFYPPKQNTHPQQFNNGGYQPGQF